MADSTLTLYDQARNALAAARNIDDVKAVRDKAEALRMYSKQVGEGLEMQNNLAEIVLRAERRAGELLAEREPHPAGRPPDNMLHDATNLPPTLSDLGINRTQSSRWQAIARIPEPTFEEHIVVTKSKKNELTTAGMLRVAQSLARDDHRDTQAETVIIPTNEQVTFLTGDFREMGKEIPDESVDLIYTDPPYDQETVPLYEDLARLGRRVLKPNGSLLAYAGHYALPEIMGLMTPFLRYWWIIALEHTTHARLPGKWVFVHWKPILWFVKGGRRDNRYVADGFSPAGAEKDLHPWQQTVAEATYYIEQLTNVGDVVLDPFMGSGTTLLAAISLNRRARGIDIDAHSTDIAKGRIAAYYAGDGGRS